MIKTLSADGRQRYDAGEGTGVDVVLPQGELSMSFREAFHKANQSRLALEMSLPPILSGGVGARPGHIIAIATVMPRQVLDQQEFRGIGFYFVNEQPIWNTSGVDPIDGSLVGERAIYVVNRSDLCASKREVQLSDGRAAVVHWFLETGLFWSSSMTSSFRQMLEFKAFCLIVQVDVNYRIWETVVWNHTLGRARFAQYDEGPWIDSWDRSGNLLS